MTLRYAIIGSGMMGQEHIRNIALLDDAHVVAVCDPDADMRDAAHALAGDTCRAFAHHRELISADIADAYVIAAPNHLHAPLLDDLLEVDTPLLVEKPLCVTEEDCQRAIDKARTRRAPVWVAMEYRYIPPVAALIERVRSGAIGQPRMLAIREHRFPFLDKVGGWNRLNRTTGGTLVEKCCHFFDLMRLIADAEPVRVFASGGQDVNRLTPSSDGPASDMLDNAFVLVDFDNGMRACLDLCMFAEGRWFQEEITATGQDGQLEARVPGPARFWPGGDERASQLVHAPRAPKGVTIEDVDVDPMILRAGDHHGSTFFQHQRFAALVRAGHGAPDVTLEDGYRAVAIGLAAERSAAERQVVALSDPPSKD